MPDVIPAVSDSAAPVSDGSQGNQSVSLESHNRLLGQRKADQDKAAAAEARAAALQAQLDAANEAKLVEQKRFEDLYTAEKQKNEAIARELAEKTAASVGSKKKAALTAALGTLKNQAYLSFANMDGIKIGADGEPDAESVAAVATAFKTAHPDLLGKSSGTLPSAAPKPAGEAIAKPISQQSEAELRASYMVARAAGK